MHLEQLHSVTKRASVSWRSLEQLLEDTRDFWPDLNSADNTTAALYLYGLQLLCIIIMTFKKIQNAIALMLSFHSASYHPNHITIFWAILRPNGLNLEKKKNSKRKCILQKCFNPPTSPSSLFPKNMEWHLVVDIGSKL